MTYCDLPNDFFVFNFDNFCGLKVWRDTVCMNSVGEGRHLGHRGRMFQDFRCVQQNVRLTLKKTSEFLLAPGEFLKASSNTAFSPFGHTATMENCFPYEHS